MTKIYGAAAKAEKPTFKESLVILKNRNVRTSMVFSCFIITWNVGVLTYAPLYLITVKGFSPEIMSYIMAVFGAGAVVWGILVPAFSDRHGRKLAVIVFTLLSIISPLGLLFFANPFAIGICAFFGWTGSGVFALFQAAIIGESIDTKYASTGIASVQMVGEIGGAVIGVMAAGILADRYGQDASFIFAAVCVVVATLVAFAYYETAPAVLAKKKL
jgi:predicted MFS family arabinose efflux permease